MLQISVDISAILTIILEWSRVAVLRWTILVGHTQGTQSFPSGPVSDPMSSMQGIENIGSDQHSGDKHEKTMISKYVY